MLKSDTTARRRLTANFHFIKSCNFRCTYCYATFADLMGRPVMPDEQVFELTRRLARRHTKLTLVGGEPTLYPRLPELLTTAKVEGALTNIVTNGSRIDATWLEANAAHLDFLTMSIDSASAETQRSLGRANQRGEALAIEHYVTLADAARRLGIVVKVNTVVTTLNHDEDMTELVRALEPERWKILQAAPVEGQNDDRITDLTPKRGDFDSYVARHETTLVDSGVRAHRDDPWVVHHGRPAGPLLRQHYWHPSIQRPDSRRRSGCRVRAGRVQQGQVPRPLRRRGLCGTAVRCVGVSGPGRMRAATANSIPAAAEAGSPPDQEGGENHG